MLGASFTKSVIAPQWAPSTCWSTPYRAGRHAIVSNITPVFEGVWRCSNNGRQSWTALPANLTDTNALVLSGATRLQLLSGLNFSDVPGGLTMQLIDSLSCFMLFGAMWGGMIEAKPAESPSARCTCASSLRRSTCRLCCGRPNRGQSACHCGRVCHRRAAIPHCRVSPRCQTSRRQPRTPEPRIKACQEHRPTGRPQGDAAHRHPDPGQLRLEPLYNEQHTKRTGCAPPSTW